MYSANTLPRALVGCFAFFCTAAIPPAVSASPDDGAGNPAPCKVGLYGDATEFAVVTRKEEGFALSFHDGRMGTIDASSAPGATCSEDALILGDGTKLNRIGLTVTDTVFQSDGVSLAGQLIEPEGADETTPLVVFAHGSEESGWIESVRDPYQLAGRGVSAFVYDKRGTGRSQGDYSQNFPQLADDLVAASLEARRLAEGRFGRFGLVGLSQGGWIAPLAAKRADADFIAIGYGLVSDILEEDAAQVQLEMREAGYGPDVQAKARQLTDVTARLAVSNYQDGLEDLDRLRGLYGDEPWFAAIKGGFSGVILAMSTDELRTNGIPMFDRLNIDWSIKPMDVMRLVDAPQLWVLAGADREAPVEITLDRLKTLRSEGRDITIRLFPDTDHGIWEFEQAEDGSRTYTRVSDGYYDLMADWAKGKLAREYGASEAR